jgi:hypothetical protein
MTNQPTTHDELIEISENLTAIAAEQAEVIRQIKLSLEASELRMAKILSALSTPTNQSK